MLYLCLCVLSYVCCISTFEFPWNWWYLIPQSMSGSNPGPGRKIPSHHSLLDVFDFSLDFSKCQMYAKLFRIQLFHFEGDSLHSDSIDCHIKWNFVSIQQIFSVDKSNESKLTTGWRSNMVSREPRHCYCNVFFLCWPYIALGLNILQGWLEGFKQGRKWILLWAKIRTSASEVLFKYTS